MPFVYILKCADGTLYTGSTTDLEKRLYEHNHTTAGAKYTRARRPVSLYYSEKKKTLSAARSREAHIKQKIPEHCTPSHSLLGCFPRRWS
jgi:putative endonuclease